MRGKENREEKGIQRREREREERTKKGGREKEDIIEGDIQKRENGEEKRTRTRNRSIQRKIRERR